jgi:hypothetical protein
MAHRHRHRRFRLLCGTNNQGMQVGLIDVKDFLERARKPKTGDHKPETQK